MAPTREPGVVKRFDRLRLRLSESDALVRLLRAQIAKLSPTDDDTDLMEEERSLRRENAQLCIRVEQLRAQLLAVESVKGLESSPTEPEAEPVAVEEPKKCDESAAPTPPQEESKKRKKQKEKKTKKKKKDQNENISAPVPSGEQSALSGGPRCPDRASLMTFLASLGISDIQERDHPEVFTVETMMPHLEGMAGVVGKNLFLKDKKKNLFLLSAKHDAHVRLNEVAKQVGASGGLRLADETILVERLGVRQGAVNPFALANDAARAVTFLLDRDLLAGTRVNFHPMSNAATLSLRVEDFQSFLTAVDHAPVVISL